MNIHETVQAQRAYFSTGATLPVSFRLEMLRKLRDAVDRRERDLADALSADLGKSAYESFMCEIGLARTEITYMLRHTRRLAGERTVRTPLAQFAARSFRKPSPYGNTLIMSPWNYPVLLTLDPLADAIAAGNTAVVKPSAYAPAASALLAEIIGDCFPAEYVAAVTGGRRENAALLEEKFDFIFFTGSQEVGKEVLRRAAEHLTPAVLELGGKSPVIVDRSANIPLTAKRLAFGKLLNAGQTCVAPDYCLVDRTVKDQLVEELIRQFKKMLGPRPLENPDFVRIINRKHFNRLQGLLEGEAVLWGGGHREDPDHDTGWIAPTLIADTLEAKSKPMGEEIFGPILPILPYRELREAVAFVNSREKPLALYLFSRDRARQRTVLGATASGGACINDTVVHLSAPALPFGGVGQSGMGAYHGRASFDTFTHYRGVLRRGLRPDLPIRYPPYNDKKLALIRRLLK